MPPLLLLPAYLDASAISSRPHRKVPWVVHCGDATRYRARATDLVQPAQGERTAGLQLVVTFSNHNDSRRTMYRQTWYFSQVDVQNGAKMVDSQRV
ncbi:MAG: hypothetical protein ABI604_17775 [Nitrospirota bacterium]